MSPQKKTDGRVTEGVTDGRVKDALYRFPAPFTFTRHPNASPPPSLSQQPTKHTVRQSVDEIPLLAVEEQHRKADAWADIEHHEYLGGEMQRMDTV